MSPSKRGIRFTDLEYGDIFTIDERTWYMKTPDIYDDCGDLYGNCVKLSNGNNDIIIDEIELVTKLNKNLIIEYSKDDLEKWTT